MLKQLAGGTANFLEVFRVVEKNAQSDVFKVPESGVPGMNRDAVLQKVINWRKIEQRNMESVCRLLSNFVAECHDIQSGWLWVKLWKYFICINFYIYIDKPLNRFKSKTYMKYTVFQKLHNFYHCNKSFAIVTNTL